MNISQEDRDTMIDFIIYTWTTAVEYNGMPRSKGITSLVDYMAEQGRPKKEAAKRVLKFFQETGMDANEVLELWQMIMKE
jgi:hypothetical protein